MRARRCREDDWSAENRRCRQPEVLDAQGFCGTRRPSSALLPLRPMRREGSLVCPVALGHSGRVDVPIRRSLYGFLALGVEPRGCSGVRVSGPREWGVRLADIRLPRLWPFAVLGALLLARRRHKRDLSELERIGRDIGDSVVARWRENDDATEAMIRLTRTLTVLTWVLVFVGFATLAVGVVTLAQG